MPSRATLFCLPLALLGAAPLARAAPPLEALRMLDLRLAVVATRLTQANAARCAAQAPGTGLVLHAADQYPPDLRDAARATFGFGAPLAVELVVPASAGALAGVQPGDGIVAVNGIPLPSPALASGATSARRDAALAQIAALPPDAPLTLDLARGDARLSLVLHPHPMCRTGFELDSAEPLTARSDGRVIQLGPGWFERYGDDAAAVIFAHELAHTALGHRAMLGEHPARAATRMAEDAADLFSLTLLRDAGYDPAIAPRFWREHGAELGRWRLHLGAHAGPVPRAMAMEAELARQQPPALSP